MTSPCALIGLDWGTTSFRAYRLGADGGVIEAKSAPSGILKVPAGGFEQVFEQEIGPWLAERARPAGDRRRHDHQPPGLGRGALLSVPGRQ